jgi:hypothetical protein
VAGTTVNQLSGDFTTYGTGSVVIEITSALTSAHNIGVACSSGFNNSNGYPVDTGTGTYTYTPGPGTTCFVYSYPYASGLAGAGTWTHDDGGADPTPTPTPSPTAAPTSSPSPGTATPWPTSTQPPGGGYAGGPAGDDDQCWHADDPDFDTGVTGRVWGCLWTPANEAGSMADWRSSPWEWFDNADGFDGLKMDYPITAASGVMLHTSAHQPSSGRTEWGMRVGATVHTIQVQIQSVQYRASDGDLICQTAGAYWFDGPSVTARLVGTTKGETATCNTQATFGTGTSFFQTSAELAVPEGATYFQPVLFCEAGDCPNGSSLRYWTIQMLVAGDTRTDAGDAVPVDCYQAGFCGHDSGAPGAGYDPVSGTAGACGPITGDCSKPFIGYLALNTCVTPDGALDVVGWLSYIACLVGNVPTWIINAIIWGLNGLIDALFPSNDWLVAIGEDMDAIGERPPFVWIATVQEGISGALTAPSAAGLPVSNTIYGVSVDTGGILALAAETAAPWRGWLVALVRLGYMYWLFSETLAFLGRRRNGSFTEMTFGL